MAYFGFPELVKLAAGVTGRSYAEVRRRVAASSSYTDNTVKAWYQNKRFPTGLRAEDAFEGLFAGAGTFEDLAAHARQAASEPGREALARAVEGRCGARGDAESEDAYRDLALAIIEAALSPEAKRQFAIEKNRREAARRRSEDAEGTPTAAGRAPLPQLIAAVDRAMSADGKSHVTRAGDGDAFGYFDQGFETHELYRTLVSHAKRRFLAFGRKNSKLFCDGSYLGAFRVIGAQPAGAFDFRCLFLDPEADEAIIATAQDRTGFLDDLRYSITRAGRVLAECGMDPHEACRLYRTRRQAPLVIVDDFAFFRGSNFGDDMMPEHFTGNNFCYARVGEGLGAECLKAFEQAWAAAQPLPARA